MNMHHSSVHQRRSLLIAVILLWFFGITMPTSAQTEACGDIVTPVNFYFEGSEEDRRAIVDCTNPFAKTANIENFYLGEELVQDQGIVYSIDPIKYYGIPGVEYRYINRDMFFYKHTTSDYERINIKYETPPRQDYYEIIARLIPGNAARIDFYTDILSADNPRSYLYTEIEEGVFDHQQKTLDPFTGETVEDVYFSLSELVEEQIVYPRTPLGPGTYTAVWVVSGGGGGGVEVSIHPWLRWFIPVAYASTIDIRTITFTIATPLPEPTGASSVLFLPGIQASRLYTEGLLGTEDQLWTPTWNQDVRQLRMTETGESIEDIYTRDILDQVTGLGTVYKQFSETLDSLVAAEIIKDWEPYAYDWRYAVDDVVTNGAQYEYEVKRVETLIHDLAKDSYSGKVTIVAHSNGGLLAKSLLTKLQAQGEENVVDRLILLASPQWGTPKAVGTILHGFDQEAAGGIIIDARVARNVIRNMPGAYGLLPTTEYFNAIGKEIIKFETGDAIDQLRSVYGTGIDSAEEMSKFLIGTQDGRNDASSIYEAAKVNQALYEKSVRLHNEQLQAWRAGSTTQVIEVVGVGLQTVSGFTYREFLNRVCTTEFFVETCQDKKYYKPVPVFSLYGDETVMAQSAKGYQGSKETYFVDLSTQRSVNPSSKFKHVNFSELPSVRTLVSKVLKNESVEGIPFISTTVTIPTATYEVLAVHSPATVSVQNREGNTTEIVFSGEDFVRKKEEIPGSSIYYLGSTTYVVLPSEDTYQINLEGTGPGGVTLAIDTLHNDVASTTHRVWIPDTQKGMQITATLQTGKLLPVLIDTTGDGTVEYTIDPQTGTMMPVIVAEGTSQKNSKTGTKVKQDQRPVGAVAGISVSAVDSGYYQQLFSLLQQLQLLLNEYEKSLR